MDYNETSWMKKNVNTQSSAVSERRTWNCPGRREIWCEKERWLRMELTTVKKPFACPKQEAFSSKEFVLHVFIALEYIYICVILSVTRASRRVAMWLLWSCMVSYDSLSPEKAYMEERPPCFCRAKQYAYFFQKTLFVVFWYNIV